MTSKSSLEGHVQIKYSLSISLLHTAAICSHNRLFIFSFIVLHFTSTILKSLGFTVNKST
ncbi:MAG: hypothetical protein Q8S84_09425 [bacterium]|nr:hypothetical protein [bacterium]MDP3381639.1 hypothetical protein [bacterium]